MSKDSSNVRAGDADREVVARTLHDAFADGRINATELGERLAVVYSAKTVGDLSPVTIDLVPMASSGLRAPAIRRGGQPTSRSAVAIFSSALRKGSWVIGPEFNAVALFGGVQIDLTTASFSTGEATLNVTALCGGVEIIVDDSVTVISKGFAIFGGFEDESGTVPAGGPILRVKGVALMGGVSIKRFRSR